MKSLFKIQARRSNLILDLERLEKSQSRTNTQPFEIYGLKKQIELLDWILTEES